MTGGLGFHPMGGPLLNVSALFFLENSFFLQEYVWMWLAILGIWCIVCPVTEFSTTSQRSIR